MFICLFVIVCFLSDIIHNLKSGGQIVFLKLMHQKLIIVGQCNE